MNEEVLSVTINGEFKWHPDADRLIETGDYSNAPAMQHILRALRKKREFVGLTEDEAFACQGRDYFETYKKIEAKLKEKNGG